MHNLAGQTLAQHDWADYCPAGALISIVCPTKEIIGSPRGSFQICLIGMARGKKQPQALQGDDADSSGNGESLRSEDDSDDDSSASDSSSGDGKPALVDRHGPPSDAQAELGARVHSQMKILMSDLMVYLEQEDLVITEAREAKLAQMLTSAFCAAMKNKGRFSTDW